MNLNFDVDWQAYEEVELGLKKLIQVGQLASAQTLALRLIKDGSYQVGCSDEGMVTENMEGCWQPVIPVMRTAGGEEASPWAAEVLRADRLGFIRERELKRLAKL